MVSRRVPNTRGRLIWSIQQSKRGSGRVLRHHADAGQLRQQRDQRPLARQHHARAAGDHQRQIAGKLDRVAKTLLGMHQDRAAAADHCHPIAVRADRRSRDGIGHAACAIRICRKPSAKSPASSAATAWFQCAWAYPVAVRSPPRRQRSPHRAVPARGQDEAQAGVRLRQIGRQADCLATVSLRVIQPIESTLALPRFSHAAA